MPNKLAKGLYKVSILLKNHDYLDTNLKLLISIKYKNNKKEEYFVPLSFSHEKEDFILRIKEAAASYSIDLRYRDVNDLSENSLGDGFTCSIQKSALQLLNRKKYKFYKNVAQKGALNLSWLNRISFYKYENGNEHPNPLYNSWIKDNEPDSAGLIAQAQEDLKTLENKPLISIIMPSYNGDCNILTSTVESVLGQVYPHWELCIADDASTNPKTIECLKQLEQRDERIKIVFRTKNGHISEASNSAIEIAEGEYITFLDHDDLLRPHSLIEFVKKLNEYPSLKFIFSDEDTMNTKGQRIGYNFKLGYNIELLRKCNYICHMTMIKKSIVDDIKGFRKEFDGAQDYDLFLRALSRLDRSEIAHIPKILYHWRAVEGSTAASSGEKPYAIEAGRRALSAAIQKDCPGAYVRNHPELPFRYLVQYPVDASALVSIIIPTKDKIELLSICIASILYKTNYKNYEIVIVNNRSEDPDSYVYFAKISEAHANIRVVDYDAEFNFAEMMNLGVQEAKGDYVLLLNNDIEVINHEWLDNMLSVAQQKDVGCVGAKLLYPDHRLQHAGVFLTAELPASHSYVLIPDGALVNEYLIGHQDVSAVTAACLLVCKKIYQEAGGMNGEKFRVAYNDVDFCLSVMDLGYRNVWTPTAILYHYESASRGAEDQNPERWAEFLKERDNLIMKWKKYIDYDPYYNPNLSRTKADYSLDV